MSWPRIEPGPSLWEANTRTKSYSKSVLIAIWNIYIWRPDKAPHSACGYMNINEHTWAAPGCRPKSTCKSFNPEHWHQALASPRIHYQARQITTGSPLWSMERLEQDHFHPKLEVPGNEPGPSWWEACTLAKSYSNSILIAIRNIYIWARDSLF